MLHKKYLTISRSYRDRVMYTLRCCIKLFGCYIEKELYKSIMIYVKKKKYFSNLFINRNTLFYMKTYYEDICQCYATNLFLDAFNFYCDDKRKINTTRNYSCLTKNKFFEL